MFIKILISTILLFSLTGCTLIRMTQETSEKLKTLSTHGYHNSIKPKYIRNIKDYIADKNNFVIIAESSYKTLYKLRNESPLGKFARLSNLVDYCKDINGHVQFGKQFGSSISSEFNTIDFEFSNIRSQYKSNRLPSYKGWMRCVNSGDDFYVSRKARSKYFLITHTKPQLQGYSLRWYIDYFNLNKLDIQSLNVGIWSYSAMMQLGGLCHYYQGKSTISNKYTEHRKTSFDGYLLNRLDPLNPKKGYLLATGIFSCKNSKEGRSDYTFDISYSKKYQKLLYTKRL